MRMISYFQSSSSRQDQGDWPVFGMIIQLSLSSFLLFCNKERYAEELVSKALSLDTKGELKFRFQSDSQDLSYICWL